MRKKCWELLGEDAKDQFESEDQDIDQSEKAVSVSFDKVQFGYSKEKQILNGFTFCFERGKKYALYGASGCGKSTLLSLLLGYYPDYSGSISYDGVELRELPRECLGNIVAYVSQDTFLFQDTILNNITLFDEKYTLPEVESAVEQAGLAELVAGQGSAAGAGAWRRGLCCRSQS